jgi:N-acetylglucosaminyl-diphospho-decaprenol L-rhamnosyltransferase
MQRMRTRRRLLLRGMEAADFADRAPAITVVVVSWNTRELLARCLEGLRSDADSGLADIWVVDNASGDGSAAMVRERFPWARLIESSSNIGFGAAVNLVAGQTQSDWLVAANADVSPRQGALATLLANAGEDPRAGVVAPRLVQPDGATQYTVHPFPTLRNALIFNLGLRRLIAGEMERVTFPADWDPDRACNPDWVHGALLLIRREAWEAVGGFDERQWLYAEDLDLCWRLRRAGWLTRYEPAARVEHEVSAAAKESPWGASRDLRAQRATYAWMIEQLGSPTTRLSAVINLAGAIARWIGAAILALVASARYRPRRDLYRRHVRMHLTGLEPRARLLRGR